MQVLKTLLYFSIFNYPLTKEEIFTFSNIKNRSHVDAQLKYLLSKKAIFQFSNYYSISNSKQDLTSRTLGNKKAQAILPKAKKVSGFIAKFPFVESVSISGALSKGYYDDVDGDFDFFIITKPNKLWIARTLLILYKKIFLLNSKKYFCVNYFISSSQLNISEKNRFTATEIVTLLPFYGKKTFSDFISSNQWTSKEFPNAIPRKLENIDTINKPLFSKFLETLFTSVFGEFLDESFRKITLRKWKINFGHLNAEDFEIAMKSTKNVSKHHPQHFQKNVIEKLNTNYNNMITQYNLKPLKEHG